jgi:hypothetical protein
VGEVKPPGSRPKAIAIIAAFLFLATAMASFVGTSLLFPNPIVDRLLEFK